jgi:hypothetical protein
MSELPFVEFHACHNGKMPAPNPHSLI